MKAKFDFSLSPEEAVAYLKNKGLKLSFDYRELMHEAHHTAFTVAKIMREDLLLDMHRSITEAMKEGVPFAEWKKSIKPILKSYGWYGETEVKDPRTGEVKTIHMGSRRLKTIFYTNMRVAYSVGRYRQMRSLKVSVYWRYNSMLLPTSRETHKARHGIVKHRDDPWWQINYPPNAWNCVCYVTAHTKAETERKGWKIVEHPVENIASRDWAYDVGAGSRAGKLTKIDLDASLEGLAAVKSIQKDEYKKLSQKKISEIFFQTLGVKKGEVFVDKTGDAVIADGSFLHQTSGRWKGAKSKRNLFIKEIALTLRDPDEVFLEFEVPDGEKKKRRARAVKKYFRYFRTESGAKRAMLVIVALENDKSVGVTAYFAESNIEGRRSGYLIYSRKRVQDV